MLFNALNSPFFLGAVSGCAPTQSYHIDHASADKFCRCCLPKCLLGTKFLVFSCVGISHTVRYTQAGRKFISLFGAKIN